MLLGDFGLVVLRSGIVRREAHHDLVLPHTVADMKINAFHLVGNHGFGGCFFNTGQYAEIGILRSVRLRCYHLGSYRNPIVGMEFFYAFGYIMPGIIAASGNG